MRGQPELLVECDGEKCKAKEVVELRATAHGNYSEDHVCNELRSRGWYVDEAGELCGDCARKSGLIDDEGEEE